MKQLEFSATPGRTVMVDGTEHLFFSGYAYLGMHQVPAFTELVKEGIDLYGPLFPSSRISNTQLSLYATAEAMLAALTGSEDAVLVASGFTAGSIAVEQWQHELINLEPSHPAIKKGDTKRSARSCSNIYAVDAVNPVTAAVTDFSFVLSNSAAKTVIVDDSHGIGLLGEKGEGIAAYLPKNSNTDYIISCSLSKALNIIAGAICCSRQHAAVFRKMPAYTASTPPSPALLHAFVHGQKLYAAQRALLHNNIAYFQSCIQDLAGIRFHPALPVFILPDTVDDTILLAHHIIISSFAYPDPSGRKINRVVLNALHTREDLDRLAAVLHHIMAA